MSLNARAHIVQRQYGHIQRHLCLVFFFSLTKVGYICYIYIYIYIYIYYIQYRIQRSTTPPQPSTHSLEGRRGISRGEVKERQLQRRDEQFRIPVYSEIKACFECKA